MAKPSKSSLSLAPMRKTTPSSPSAFTVYERRALYFEMLGRMANREFPRAMRSKRVAAAIAYRNLTPSPPVRA